MEVIAWSGLTVDAKGYGGSVLGLNISVFPLIRLTILSLADQVNFYLIYRVISNLLQLTCPEIKRIYDDVKKKYFRSSDPYLLHWSGNTYILKALLIYYFLLTTSYDRLTLDIGNVRKCLYLYPVFENKLKKKLLLFATIVLRGRWLWEPVDN